MEVRLYATLRTIAGARSVTLGADCATVGDVLARLVERHPSLDEYLFDGEGGVGPFVAIMVDDRDVRHLRGVETPVTPDSQLDIFPPVAGGSA